MRVPPEHELVERCRLGDEAAFRELVDQYKGMVYSLVTRSVPNRARADEIAQDVFLRVHKGLPYFRGESKLSTWIYRIVANALAQEPREPRAISIDEAAASGERAPILPGVEDRAFGDLVLKDRLTKAIARLPAGYQVLVNGHYLKGMRYEDLAAALDLPMGTVKTHLHRAKRQLRHLLETELR
ncbi:MAG: sigma-70 family RNA polymerase sigma factor [Vicinamibacterales bacterium]|jgi:RNA polymerase sigma-70 factor (ECF subfamily)